MTGAWFRRRAAAPAVASAVAALALLPLVSGCAKGREYAVPADICGVKMPEKLSEPFLPDGEELRNTRERVPYSDRHYVQCEIYVDGKLVLKGEIAESPRVPEPVTDDRENSLDHFGRIDKLPFSGWGQLDDEKAVGYTRCRSDPKGRTDALSYQLSFKEPQVEGSKERRDAIKKFTRAFVKGEKAKEGCTRR